MNIRITEDLLHSARPGTAKAVYPFLGSSSILVCHSLLTYLVSAVGTYSQITCASLETSKSKAALTANT